MRILLFGDTLGVSQLLHQLPYDAPVGIVGSSIRPQYIEGLQALAREVRVPFFIQPKWKASDYKPFINEVRALAPDLIWVNSYSMILRDDLLECARLGGLNIHAALLPKNRGCNPIQWAIIKGEHKTGVTLHQIDSGIDTGPIIDQQTVPISFEDNWLDVAKKIKKATDSLIIENLPQILSENWSAVSQSNRNATVGKRRTPEDGLFSWSQPIVEIYNKVRALLPPLPPAFYKEKDGQQRSIYTHLSVWQLAQLKHEWGENGAMRSNDVRLRPLQESDSELLYDWIKEPELGIYTPPLFPVFETDNQPWVEGMMNEHFDLVIFVIEDLSSGEAIDTCQLRNINCMHRSAELKMRIGPSTLRGRGFGSDAIRLLCDFGFYELNLHRIYQYVLADHSRAIRSYEKCGFQREGILREAIDYQSSRADVVLMALRNT